ncbi:DUF6377 domain-containing protein [Bacteroides sp. UBA939]|uniref:DUF6377 domain-containing protein n=1 Tax=Bacteroides sp. UBA939 TaxID=1946092 RepID=UPI0025BEA3ED|nr:DUF6377 domain-containing protein [Bacteroides sp. UBA939]
MKNIINSFINPCNLFFLILFIVSLVGCTNHPSPISLYKKQLTTLDSLVALRIQIQAEKEQEIKAAKNKLGSLPAFSSKRYDLNKEIQQCYRGYICDSLIYYIYENIKFSKYLKDDDKTLESEISLAIYLAKSGMYLEAMVLMDSIKRANVNEELLDLYYRAYNIIYRQKAYISKDKVLAEQVFAPLAKIYQDSLLAVLDSGSNMYYNVHIQKYMDEKKFTEALKLSENRLASLTPGDREYAAVWYNIGDVKNIMGDKNGFFEAMLNSAIADMKHCIKDHASLHRIARTLYEWDEVSRAANYIQICMEDVYFYNANLRSLQIAKTLPVVTQAYEKKNQTYITNLRTEVAVIFLLLFFCTGILIVVVVQKNKLSRMHRKLQESNDNLNVLSRKLADTNTHLNEVNNKLTENSYIKENYVAHFISLSSEYIDKNHKFRLEVNKVLRKGKIEEALRMTLSAGADEKDLEEFYANFDEAFLSIFPHFIEKYNNLMTKGAEVILTDKQKECKTLTSELRVFALIRLGFSDSATIAQMLRYSINTIYNIRSKAKNKAVVSKESFESLIMKIGTFPAE